MPENYRPNYERAVEKGNDIFIELAPDGTVVYISGQVAEYGWTQNEIIGKNFLEFIHPDDHKVNIATFAEAVKSGIDQPTEFRALANNGTHPWFTSTLSPQICDDGTIVLSGFLHNITNRKNAELQKYQLELQLRQAMKMEAIGRLAGGIAHDFNNILTAIIGYSEMMATTIGQKHTFYEDVKEIETAAKRAARLTDQLLAFSREKQPETIIFDLKNLIFATKKMLKRAVHDNIRLRINFDEEKYCVTGDPSQIQQVIINLVINAQDAMPNGGDITISVNETWQGTKCFAIMTVEDNGEGIPAEQISKIFDPFFTTKPIGKGTGLGLSVAYSVIEQHNGRIEVHSEVGRGSVFSVYLPRTESEAPRFAGDNSGPHSPGNGEKILLIEDSSNLRRMITRALLQLGYRVDAVESAELGLQTINTTHGLVICDIALPGMSGLNFATAHRINHPIIPIILTSGNVSRSDIECIERQNIPFIPKPFSLVDLTNLVAKELAQKTAL